MNNVSIFKENGVKYFKLVNNKVEIIRIIGIQNKDKIKIKYDDGHIEKIPYEFLANNGYTKLKPDAYIVFNIVQCPIGKDKYIDDIIICVYKQSELEEKNPNPYIVCRQNINDLFYEYAAKVNSTEIKQYAGMSMSIDSAPAGFDFKNMLACSSVSFSISVGYYIDDTVLYILENILKTAKFDNVLNSLYIDHIKYIQYTTNTTPNTELQSIDGWCKSLAQLVKENNLQFDIDSMFKIYTISSEIEIIKLPMPNKTIVSSLSLSMMRTVSNLVQLNLVKTYVVKFNKSINLDELNMPYFFIRDCTNTIYLIGFVAEGEYMSPDYNIEEAKEKLKHIVESSKLMPFTQKYI